MLRAPNHLNDPELMAAFRAVSAGDHKSAIDQLARSGDMPNRRHHLVEVMADQPGEQPWLATWREEQPTSVDAWLVSGAHAYKEAKRHRGSGTSATVSPAARAKWDELNVVASEMLHKAKSLNETDAEPLARLIRVDANVNGNIEHAHGYFQTVLERCPDHLFAGTEMIAVCTRKWYGSTELMFEIANKVSASAGPGSPMHAVLPLAHIEQWLDLEMFLEESARATAWITGADAVNDLRRSAQAVEQGLDKLDHATRIEVANIFAFAMSMSRQKELARVWFERCEETVTLIPWQYWNADVLEGFQDIRWSTAPLWRQIIRQIFSV